jgi:prepilin-type N-terminal cleavage/methylation domain-containing protein/prepilin-type processing-associated H-X9-DG protein
MLRRRGEESLAMQGFTIVELLVVIAIIGILVALIIPAVQMARESARRSACANNLKQHGIAIDLHTQSHKTFPTGGWGGDWLGDPDAGYAKKQPGGWIYNILPFVEQQPLRDLGAGMRGPQREQALQQLMQSPLDIFTCPSRRPATVYPYDGPGKLQNAVPATDVAKSDYAINNLVSHKKSDVIVSEIQFMDGMSNTVLAAEKGVPQGEYRTGKSSGDRLIMYVGDSSDIARKPSGSPTNDTNDGTGFGSIHPGGCNVLYCDGSVKFMTSDEAF